MRAESLRSCVQSGAIIGDGDRKYWDPRAPMIWDNFSTFRTNCAIMTTYIRADPRTCRGLSRVCFHVAWSNGVIKCCEIFQACGLPGYVQQWQRMTAVNKLKWKSIALLNE